MKINSKNWHWWFLGLIFLAVVFVRTYHFSDWLVFRHDQARDARYAKEAFDEGIDHLRMLGPKGDVVRLESDSGRGQTMNLGPAYYEMQYLSAIIVGRTDPEVFAYPDLIFSLFSIILFYFLLAKFFSRKISLLVTALYSFSFILTQYTRMAYNPNQLFFWQLLFIIGLLEVSSNKDRKKAGYWLLATFFAFSIMSQVHFTAFFGFPLVAIIFWLVYRPQKINWRYWAGAVAILVLMYLPAVVADIKNEGDNFQRFVAALTREREDSEWSLMEKINENSYRQGEFHALALSSFHDREFEWIGILGTVFLLVSLALISVSLLANRIRFLSPSIKKELIKISQGRLRVFLTLLLIWAVVFWLIYFKIVGRLERPRYFLPIAPLPFILIAFWFWLIAKMKDKLVSNVLIFGLAVLLLGGNFYGIYYWYTAMANGKEVTMAYRDPQLRRHKDLIGLGALKESAEYITNRADKNRNICMSFEDYQYKNPYRYIFSQYHPGYRLKNFSEDEVFADCSFFVFEKDKKGKGELDEDFLVKFSLINQKRFGAFLIFEIKPKKGTQKIPLVFEDEDDEKRAMKWRDLFK